MDDLRREAMLELLQLTDIVDLAIPRGGEGLIRFVTETCARAGDQALQGRLPSVRGRAAPTWTWRSIC